MEALKYYDRALGLIKHPKYPAAPLRNIYINKYYDDDWYAIYLDKANRKKDAHKVRNHRLFESPPQPSPTPSKPSYFY